jgi:hypothetical protein
MRLLGVSRGWETAESGRVQMDALRFVRKTGKSMGKKDCKL